MIYPTQPRKGKKRGEPLGTRPNKSRKRAQREQEPRQREDPGRNKHTITRGGTKCCHQPLKQVDSKKHEAQAGSNTHRECLNTQAGRLYDRVMRETMNEHGKVVISLPRNVPIQNEPTEHEPSPKHV